MSFYEVSGMNHESKNIQKFVFLKPKKINNKQISKVFYDDDSEQNENNDRKQFVINTRKLQVIKNNISKNGNENFINFHLLLAEENSELCALFSELDELNTTKVIENSKNWFGQKLDLEQADDAYKSYVKYNIKERYAYIVVPIPISETNNLLVDVINQYRRKITFNELLDATQLDIKLLFSGIYFNKKSFTPIFEPIIVKAYLKKTTNNDEYLFTNEDEGIDFIDDLNEDEEEFSDDEKYLENDENEENCEKNCEEENNENEENCEKNCEEENNENEENCEEENCEEENCEVKSEYEESIQNVEKNEDILENIQNCILHTKEENGEENEMSINEGDIMKEDSLIKNIRINRDLEKSKKKKKVINNGRKKKFLNKF
jgi:hypothetical protein